MLAANGSLRGGSWSPGPRPDDELAVLSAAFPHRTRTVAGFASSSWTPWKIRNSSNPGTAGRGSVYRAWAIHSTCRTRGNRLVVDDVARRTSWSNSPTFRSNTGASSAEVARPAAACGPRGGRSPRPRPPGPGRTVRGAGFPRGEGMSPILVGEYLARPGVTMPPAHGPQLIATVRHPATPGPAAGRSCLTPRWRRRRRAARSFRTARWTRRTGRPPSTSPARSRSAGCGARPLWCRRRGGTVRRSGPRSCGRPAPRPRVRSPRSARAGSGRRRRRRSTPRRPEHRPASTRPRPRPRGASGRCGGPRAGRRSACTRHPPRGASAGPCGPRSPA